jgi:hypothetical protein
MSKIAGDINREMMKKTYTIQELAHAKGVPSMVTSAMLAIGEDCVKASEKLHALKEASKLMLEELEIYHRQYPGMAKGYVLDAENQLKAVLKEVEK